MSETIYYKGFAGSMTRGFEKGVTFLHGEILNTRDLITYESDTIDGLWDEFEKAVDEYIKDKKQC